MTPDAPSSVHSSRQTLIAMSPPLTVANTSAGCSMGWRLPQSWPTIVNGGSAVLTLPTQKRPFRLSLPTSYGTSSSPPALLLHFHGWGGTVDDAKDSFHAHGIANGYLVASPLGFDDDGTQATSWNGAGTTGSSGNRSSCHDPSHSFANLCYSRSCGSCNDTCWWSTCESCAYFSFRSEPLLQSAAECEFESQFSQPSTRWRAFSTS